MPADVRCTGVVPPTHDDRPISDLPTWRQVAWWWLRHPPVWARFGVIIALSVAFAVVAGPVVRLNASAADFMRQMAVPFAMLTLVLLVAMRHERRWRVTTAALADLVDDVRRGRTGDAAEIAAREVTARCDGNSELVRLARSVMRLADDARRTHRRARQLESECERRVNRTADALGHEIGVLKTRAGTDALTGLGNRRSLDETLPRYVDAARRSGGGLCAVMIDVDNFKPLNDTLGHAAGDAVLRDIARLIGSAVRERDAAFRYGGDEFVLLLPGVDARQARATADRLARLVDDLARTLGVPQPPALSCGVADLARLEPGAGPDALLRDADRDAYRIKRFRRGSHRVA